MSSFSSIRRTCTPRDDVLKGGLTDAHFAAQLDRIVRDPSSYPAYGDPDSFFSLTYPTQGLQELLRRAFGRISGARVPGAEHGLIRSETSFGGGKTHGLIALYHIAQGARPTNLSEFIDPSILPETCQVAAVVGDQLDPINGIETNNQKTFTLWGEIGAQLGESAFEVLRQSDETRTAPSKDALGRAFGGKPTIIIIDEIAQYLRMLTSSGDEGARRLAKALPVFLKNLLELAAGDSNIVVILTLATSQDAFHGETDELDQVMKDAQRADMEDAVKDTTSVVGRFTGGGSIVKPADDAEIGEILKRRLFDTIDPEAAKDVAERYGTFYEDLLAKGEHLPGGADKPSSYRERIESTYPFHPELIRVLDQRLGTIPSFQRARGALKLLAEVVAGIWRDEVDVPVLNVGDVHFENPHVLAHLTTGLGRDEFERVARSDFVGPSSHAVSIDSGRMIGKNRITRRAAGTVFTHSLELQANAGAGRPDVVLGTLRLGESGDLVVEALNELDESAWFLAYEHNRYRFMTEPNPNAIVATAERNLTNARVAEEMRYRIEEAFPTDKPVTVVPFPAGPQDVPDNPRLFRLVVVHHDDVSVRSGDPAPSGVVEMMNKTGSAGANRMNRNGVAFLVADVDQIEGFKRQVRRDLAALSIVEDAARMQEFSEPVRKRVQSVADTAKLEARVALARCYKHLFVPSGDKSTDYLKHEELPPASQGTVKKQQTRVVLEYLQETGKVRTTDLGPQYLEAKAWPRDEDGVTTEALMASFWRDHSVPLILNATLLQSTIRKGVESGRWVYYDAESATTVTSKDAPPAVAISENAYLYKPEKAQELGLLAKPIRVKDVTDILLGEARLDGVTLRSKLEKFAGAEPKKGEVLQVLARAAEGGENARAFVVRGEPQEGEKPLAPSEITKVGLVGSRGGCNTDRHVRVRRSVHATRTAVRFSA